jgi:glycosyltransferase involved in cell wall biosynthesis
MARYETYLRTCSGLLFCSLHEGLGIPPLEAILHGCPLLLSDLPSLRETCDGAARFVDPGSSESIEQGIEDLLADPHGWSERSAAGAKRYHLLSADTPLRCLRLYERLTGGTVVQPSSRGAGLAKDER